MRHELLTQSALGVNAKKGMPSQHFVTHVVYLLEGHHATAHGHHAATEGHHATAHWHHAATEGRVCCGPLTSSSSTTSLVT